MALKNLDNTRFRSFEIKDISLNKYGRRAAKLNFSYSRLREGHNITGRWIRLHLGYYITIIKIYHFI